MQKCSFCGEELPEGRGIMFVKRNGEIFYFCKRKCYVNFEMRNPAKVKWTTKYRSARVSVKQK